MENKAKRILFRCDSMYQLLNAVWLKKERMGKIPGDLILSDHTEFDHVIPGLCVSRLFEHIYQMKSKEAASHYWNLSKEERRQISRHPEEYADIDFLEEDYTDFYLSFDTAYVKLMYYAMIQKGMKLKVHLFEDGMATYVCDVEKRCKEDGMDHAFYGTKSFLENIEELLLYEPEYFTGPQPPFPLEKIPAIDCKNIEVCQMFLEIFGDIELPEEPYIFLEEAFFDDRIPSNDLELCQSMAALVGKENMVIKRHPRNRVNRFRDYGFRTMEQSKVPWEILLMKYDICQKILVTVSSNASITANLIFSKNMNVIMLYPMFIGKTWLMGNRNFKEYHEKVLNKMNRERKNIFCPHSFDEVREIQIYIEGATRIERRIEKMQS